MRLLILALGIAFCGWSVADTPSAPPSNPPSAGASGSDGGYVIEKKGNTTIKYKKKTQYDFEGSNIDGMYNKPSGSYISNIKDVKAKSIIHIRENFDDEVLDSTRLVK